MKNSIVNFSVLISLCLLFSACGEKAAEEIVGAIVGDNEYLVNVDGDLYESGTALSGIGADLIYEEAITANASTAISITFDKGLYKAGQELMIGDSMDEDATAVATGTLIFNRDTDNAEVRMYIAKSGYATVVSKKRIEFDLNCYYMDDYIALTGGDNSVISFTISGYITESDPE